MARAISDTQKKAVFTNLPSSITIGEDTINASKIYVNQAITSYPTVTFNFSNDGQTTDIRDVSDGVLYYSCTLTIHILTENTSSYNGARIAEQFASDIITEIESWTTPLTSDVRIFNPDEDVNSIGNMGYDGGIFDYILSITLYHS